MARNRSPSLVHDAQKHPRDITVFSTPDTASTMDAFYAEGQKIVVGTTDDFVFEGRLMDLARARAAERYALHPEEGTRHISRTLTNLQNVTAINWADGDTRVAIVLVPANKTSLFFPATENRQGKVCVYFLTHKPGEKKIQLEPCIMVVDISDPEKANLQLLIPNSRLLPQTLASKIQSELQKFSHVLFSYGISALSVLQNDREHIHIESRSHGHGGGRHGPRHMPSGYPATRIVQVNPRTLAIIERTRTDPAAYESLTGRTYEHPFVVEEYQRFDGTAVKTHAKGGTEQQRTLLNAMLIAGNELGLRQALSDYGSPQAGRPIQVRLARNVPGEDCTG